MGTRSLTIFEDNHSGQEIVVMYRQFDGYPEGHGTELANFLLGMKVTNGIGGPLTANGMGCLAAQVVSHFKHEHGIGNIYLYPAETRDVWEEYTYDLRSENGVIQMCCREHRRGEYNTLFEGTPEQYIHWITNDRNEEEE